MSEPIKSYLKRVQTLQAAVIALPIGSAIVTSRTVILGPPLGQLNLLVVPFGVILAGLGMLIPTMVKAAKSLKKLATTSALACVLCFLIYGYFVERFVVTVHISSQNRSVLRSVGAKLAAPYEGIYGNQSNAEILKDQGFEEDDIERVWSRSSLAAVRMIGLCSYVVLLCGINTCIGAFAKIQDLTKPKWTSKP